MKRRSLSFLLALFFGLLASAADAARVRVVHRGPRTAIRLHAGFPLHRALPRVYVRAPLFTLRVAPRIYLPRVSFTAVVLATPPPVDVTLWRGGENLERGDDWTEFHLDVDRRGDRLLLEVEKSAARISFVEVVFENGETQVVDFADRRYAPGQYSLLEFRDGRKIDHLRMVAKADRSAARVGARLIS